MSNTLKFGNGEWYGKKDTILAYNDENSNYKPLPFNFSRASKATVVNKDGLIEEVGSGQPRIDYKDDSKGALKLEPTRSNLITYSEDFSSVQWNKESGVVVTDNYGISPDGTQNSTRLQLNALNKSIYYAITVGSASIFSIYIKGIQGEIIRVSNTGGTLHTFTGGWDRVECYDSVGNATNVSINSYGGSTTALDMEIYGAQVEEGSFPTSYIKSNSGNVVTRLADDIDTDFGTILPLNGEVSVYMEMLGQPSDVINTTGKLVSVNFDSLVTSNSYISLNFNGTNWRARVQNATGSNFVSFDVDQTETIKALFVLRPTSYALYANGSLIGSETRTYSGTAPNINEISKVIYLMQSDSFGITRNKDLRVYNTALSNAEAIALTQV